MTIDEHIFYFTVSCTLCAMASVALAYFVGG